jgi:hypothetical protein
MDALKCSDQFILVQIVDCGDFYAFCNELRSVLDCFISNFSPNIAQYDTERGFLPLTPRERTVTWCFP